MKNPRQFLIFRVTIVVVLVALVGTLAYFAYGRKRGEEPAGTAAVVREETETAVRTEPVVTENPEPTEPPPPPPDPVLRIGVTPRSKKNGTPSWRKARTTAR